MQTVVFHLNTPLHSGRGGSTVLCAKSSLPPVQRFLDLTQSPSPIRAHSISSWIHKQTHTHPIGSSGQAKKGQVNADKGPAYVYGRLATGFHHLVGHLLVVTKFQKTQCANPPVLCYSHQLVQCTGRKEDMGWRGRNGRNLVGISMVGCSN